MISHEHRCIFIHIPKCAGTSIESVLGHLDDYSGRGAQDHRSIRHIEAPLPSRGFAVSVENVLDLCRRFKIRYCNSTPNPRNRYTVTPDQYRAYYKFTFVRNPWARAFSWYKAMVKDELNRKEHGVEEGRPLYDTLVRHAGRGLLRPQLFWLKDFGGDVPLDFIGRFENLAADFREVRHRAGLPDIELPHKLKGSGEDYRDHYDSAAKRLVAEVYAEEIERFGYTF